MLDEKLIHAYSAYPIIAMDDDFGRIGGIRGDIFGYGGPFRLADSEIVVKRKHSDRIGFDDRDALLGRTRQVVACGARPSIIEKQLHLSSSLLHRLVHYPTLCL